MSWLISDDTNANSTGHLSTYDGNLYYNQDSWRLCKNMMWVGPASQKWQQSFDLDSFYSTDKDFGFNKKFNGFTFNTSAEMPSLSQEQCSLPNEQESYKNISDTSTLSKDFTATQTLYKKVESSTYKSNDKHITFTADCSGTIVAEVNDHHKRGQPDCYFYILRNGSVAAETDADSGSKMTVSYEEGDKIEFKAVNYSGRSPFAPITPYNPDISVTWESRIKEHISYYNIAQTGLFTQRDISSSQNGPSIWLWRYKRTAAINGSLTMAYDTRNTTKTYYAIYVGGVLATSFMSDTVVSNQIFVVNWSNVRVGSEIVGYCRPYFDGTAPKQYLEDEVDWVMAYCCKNEITSWDTNFSYFHTSSND